MKDRRFTGTFPAIVLFFILATTTYAKGYKGVVKLRGHHGPCEVVELIKASQEPSVTCKQAGPKKDVIVVIGPHPRHMEEGATVILKFKGERRTKVMGRIGLTAKGMDAASFFKGCASKDECMIWIDEDNGFRMIIETEKPVFKRVNQGDAVILKTKTKRIVVEGC